ncbi:MAG: ATP-dependent Clp protease ATP-binding subunit ClpX, partial [Firmicutes bacterium]|nr:ATP-dependent Clp protease ATP-binding subunit ClpX [Bacillota bacterium]
KGLGFGAEVRTSQEKLRVGEILAKIMPEDLLKFGMIPEFVGRVPIIVTLDALDEQALIRILTEPKNALVKQYKKLFELDSIDLEFTDDALRTIAAEALKRNTGARGLRAILEDIMLDVMYELPSRGDVSKCVINAEVVKKQREPILVAGPPKRAAAGAGGSAKPGAETA